MGINTFYGIVKLYNGCMAIEIDNIHKEYKEVVLELSECKTQASKADYYQELYEVVSQRLHSYEQNPMLLLNSELKNAIKCATRAELYLLEKMVDKDETIETLHNQLVVEKYKNGNLN